MGYVYSDEEFLSFTEALSEVFAENRDQDNYDQGITDYDLWGWRNDHGWMQAWRYAPVSPDSQGHHSEYDGLESVFTVVVSKKDDKDVYCLGIGDSCNLKFESLQTLIDAMTRISRSLKLAEVE